MATAVPEPFGWPSHGAMGWSPARPADVVEISLALTARRLLRE